MKQNNGDTQNTQLNSNQQNTREDYSKELIQQREIPGTPFREITDQDGNRFIAFGSYRISRTLNDDILEGSHPTTQIKETAEDYLEKNKWMIITTIAAIAVEKTLQQKEALERAPESSTINATENENQN